MLEKVRYQKRMENIVLPHYRPNISYHNIHDGNHKKRTKTKKKTTSIRSSSRKFANTLRGSTNAQRTVDENSEGKEKLEPPKVIGDYVGTNDSNFFPRRTNDRWSKWKKIHDFRPNESIGQRAGAGGFRDMGECVLLLWQCWYGICVHTGAMALCWCRSCAKWVYFKTVTTVVFRNWILKIKSSVGGKRAKQATVRELYRDPQGRQGRGRSRERVLSND